MRVSVYLHRSILEELSYYGELDDVATGYLHSVNAVSSTSRTSLLVEREQTLSA